MLLQLNKFKIYIYYLLFMEGNWFLHHDLLPGVFFQTLTTGFLICVIIKTTERPQDQFPVVQQWITVQTKCVIYSHWTAAQLLILCNPINSLVSCITFMINDHVSAAPIG